MSKTGPSSISKTINDRLRVCRSSIQTKSLDGYLVTARNDQSYLTGFDGEDGAALILPRKVYLLTDGRFAEQAAKTCPWATAVIRRGPLPDVLPQLVRKHRLKRIGFEPAALTVQAHAAFRRTAKPARLVPTPGLMSAMRLIKDPAEVRLLRRAVRIAEDAFQYVTARIEPGMTERRIAADLQHDMIRRGASEASFPTIVAVGRQSSLQHAVPGDRKVRVGSPILIDWGACYAGYRSDLTRVVFVHRIPPRFRRIYEAVLTAQLDAIRAVRPGVRMGDVDAVARASLKEAGLDAYFTHGLGHGIGLDIHEAPRLGPRVTETLRAGMVLTVEPGVYLPGVGGVRIEDDVLVTGSGAKVLSRLGKDLNSMVV